MLFEKLRGYLVELSDQVQKYLKVLSISLKFEKYSLHFIELLTKINIVR